MQSSHSSFSRGKLAATLHSQPLHCDKRFVRQAFAINEDLQLRDGITCRRVVYKRKRPHFLEVNSLLPFTHNRCIVINVLYIVTIFKHVNKLIKVSNIIFISDIYVHLRHKGNFVYFKINAFKRFF